MEKRGTFTKILAVVGTIFVWLPVLAPVLFSIIQLFTRPQFWFDYLMPAELFPLALLGGGLLIWAALRAHSQRRFIIGGLAAAAGLLILGQELAVDTGLASGETEPVGIAWTLVVASLIGYILALLVTGIGGILLLRDLFKKEDNPQRARL